MLLAIAHNPNSEHPEELFEAMKMETGNSFIDEVEPDYAAIKELQSLISPNMAK